jgi:general secretion pathway protein C
MWARAAVLAVWSLVALCAVYWGLRIFSTPLAVPSQALVVSMAPALRGDLGRLLGPDPVLQAETADEPVLVHDDRFSLLGVVSPRSAAAAREGVALIAVDGQPARAFRVGARVDGDTVLQSVTHNRVTLGPRDGAAQVALELAPPTPAAQGTLPPANSGFPARQAQPGALPTPRFVNPNAPIAIQPSYAPPQVTAQPVFTQTPVEVQDGEAQDTATDPNPLR